MLAATTISSAISFYAFFVAIVLFVRSKQWRFSFFSLAALLATATMAAFNVALYFDWAPILRISFHGKDYEFTNIFLTGVALMDGALGVGHRVGVYSREGELLARFGDPEEGEEPGRFIAPHGIAADSRGDIYGAEVSHTIRGRHLDPPRELKSIKKLRKLD